MATIGGYGTLQVADIIASGLQTVAQYGEDNLYLQFQKSLAIHNQWSQDMISMFCERTSDRLRLYGGVANVVNEEMTELALPDASKAVTGSNLGFPMQRFGSTLQWTRDYFRLARVNEMASELDAHIDQDRQRLVKQIKRAFLNPTNNLTYRDRLSSRQAANVTLPVRALLNADSTDIPLGPNGETFDGTTHNHYMAPASGTLAAADVTALITNVMEHKVPDALLMFIPQSLETTIRGFNGAGQFEGTVDVRIHQPVTSQYAIGDLDVYNTGDRKIGIYGPADVWVKPWMPANYILVVDTGAGLFKPLAFRFQEDDPSLSDFTIRYENESFPLRAQVIARDFGVAPAQRHMAAAMYYGGGTSYVAPTTY